MLPVGWTRQGFTSRSMDFTVYMPESISPLFVNRLLTLEGVTTRWWLSVMSTNIVSHLAQPYFLLYAGEFECTYRPVSHVVRISHKVVS